MRDNNRLLTWVFMLLAVASATAVIIAALIVNSGHQLPSTPISSTSAASQPQQFPTELLSGTATGSFLDNFDNANGSYDINLWDCDNDCGMENLFLRDGILILNRHNRSNKEVTNLTSRSKWDYYDLASLEGKFQISSSAIHGEIGWLSLGGDVTGCGFHGNENPFIQCDAGPLVNDKRDYATNEIPVEFDTWYTVEFVFDRDSGEIRYYLNNFLIGDFILYKTPHLVQVNVGTWSPDPSYSGEIHIDYVLLNLNK